MAGYFQIKGEKWRSIFGGRYSVSDHGRIRSNLHKRPLLMNQYPNRDGYYFVVLRVNGKYRTTHVAPLVARGFLGPVPTGKEVNHVVRDKSNNRVTNLEYVTHKENIEHSLSTGVHHARPGEQNGNVKLDWHTVIKIRKLWDSGAQRNQSALGRKFGVSHVQIKNIVTRRAW